MSYVIQAVLSNAQHPEYGQVTIPFPIPNQNYDCTIELLEPLEIGDTLRQDCQVDELDSFYTVLNALIGTQVTLDELDYLAKRLDSFDDGEAAQFQGMAHKLGLSKIKDLINLTFCCQKATVITDFSDLEKIGREHYMNLNGGCARTEDLEALDGTETAYLLIDSGAGTVTPYGVAYDNSMKLEPLYNGRQFPEYLYTNKIVDMFAADRTISVELLCENKLMKTIIDHYGESVPTRPYDEEHFAAKIEVDPSSTFYGWVFKFMGGIQIIAPQECVEEMKRIARSFL